MNKEFMIIDNIPVAINGEKICLSLSERQASSFLHSATILSFQYTVLAECAWWKTSGVAWKPLAQLLRETVWRYTQTHQG